MTKETQRQWYAVRSVIRLSETDGGDSRRYEERITLLRTGSFEEAVERAEAEAIEYTADGGQYLIEFGQVFHLFDEPGDGAEVFSLIRDSALEPDEYVTTFFDTGRERSQ